MLVTQKIEFLFTHVQKKIERLKKEEKNLLIQQEDCFVNSDSAGVKQSKQQINRVQEDIKYCYELLSDFDLWLSDSISEVALSRQEYRWIKS